MKYFLKIIPSSRLSHRRWKIKTYLRYINLVGEDYINFKEAFLHLNRYKINKNRTPTTIDELDHDDDLCN